MHLLETVASTQQKERYLRPLAAGEVRSAFAMTEPAPGAGSDPTMLLHDRAARRRRLGDQRAQAPHHRRRGLRVLHLHGAHGRGDPARRGRDDAARAGRHPGRAHRAPHPDHGPRVLGRPRAWSRFDDCRVPADAVLGEAGLGYRYAQVRLAPARLTHCMRWLGLARRALDIALDRAGERWAFGAPLLDQGMVQALVADSVIDIEASRGLIRTLCRGARRRRARDARVVGGQGLRLGGRGARRRPLAADLRRPRRQRRPAAGALRPRGARRSGSTTGRARRTVGRSPAAPRAAASASGERPGRRRRHAGGGGRPAAAAARRAAPARGVARRARPGRRAADRHAHRRRATRTRRSCSSVAASASVLRRAPRPPLPPSAHDMLREARVLQALDGRARVPRVLAVCDDASVSACRST